MASRLEPTDIPCKEKEAMKQSNGKLFGSTDDVDESVADIIDDAYVAHEKSLVRKLDMTLMPTIFILYLLNYLDRNNIAYMDPFAPISCLDFADFCYLKAIQIGFYRSRSGVER